MMPAKDRERLAWLDWMKTLAIYLIIAGHCYVPGYKYVYVFSVPAFFIMSGFLSKREFSFKELSVKMWWNLVVPMFFLFLIHLSYVTIFRLVNGTFEVDYVWKRLIGATVGMQRPGLGVLWFIYTLVILKILLQIIPEKGEKKWLLITNIMFLFLAFLYHGLNIDIANSIVNILLAMPFFSIGYILRPYKQVLNDCNIYAVPFVAVLGLVLIILCGYYNDIVSLYKCTYGDSMALCLLGGIAGTTFLWSLSRMLERFLPRLVRIIGGGTIVILGLHGIMMSIFKMTVCNLISFDGIWIYAKSSLILIAIIPIIIFCKKHIPILYGNKRV